MEYSHISFVHPLPNDRELGIKLICQILELIMSVLLKLTRLVMWEILYSYNLFLCTNCYNDFLLHYNLFQDPEGIFELIEVVGNGTYGQVYKVHYDTFTQ